MDSRSNRDTYDRVAAEYTNLALFPPERNLLGLLSDRFDEMEMLDLGVGAGRTGYTFAPLVRRYVGLDYSPRMLERARSLLEGDSGVDLVLGEAQDLSSLRERPNFKGFDLVLFSFNGIGSVGHGDRLLIFDEVRRSIASDGYFLFSAHSLNALPLPSRPEWPGKPTSLSRRIYRHLKAVRYGLNVRRSNAALDLEAARERGWVIFADPAHDFSLDVYYVDPNFQVDQLRAAGFEVELIWDNTGAPVQRLGAAGDPWLDYLCRPIREMKT